MMMGRGFFFFSLFSLIPVIVLLSILVQEVQGRCDTLTPCVINQAGRQSSDCPIDFPVCDSCMFGKFCGECSHDSSCGEGYRCVGKKCVKNSKSQELPRQVASIGVCDFVNCDNPVVSTLVYVPVRIMAGVMHIASCELVNVSVFFFFFGWLAAHVDQDPRLRFNASIGVSLPIAAGLASCILLAVYLSCGYGVNVLPKLGSKWFFCLWFNCYNSSVSSFFSSFESFEFVAYTSCLSTLGVNAYQYTNREWLAYFRIARDTALPALSIAKLMFSALLLPFLYVRCVGSFFCLLLIIVVIFVLAELIAPSSSLSSLLILSPSAAISSSRLAPVSYIAYPLLSIASLADQDADKLGQEVIAVGQFMFVFIVFIVFIAV